MTIKVHDPQHGHLRDATQGDLDNAHARIAALEAQIAELNTQIGQGVAADPAPAPASAASSSRGGPAKEA